MACPRRTEMSSEEAEVCPIVPDWNPVSAGVFSLAASFDAQRTARSATVLKPASEQVVCTWYGIERDPKSALKLKSRADQDA
eukprot:6456824-Amphidinium_carterae.1